MVSTIQSASRDRLAPVAGTPLGGSSSIVEVIARRAELTPDETALVFLRDGDADAEVWSYRDLWTESTKIAHGLRAVGVENERVVLLFPPGLSYVAAFLGTLAASATAVPLHPPLGKRPATRVSSVLADCDARVILSAPDFIAAIPNVGPSTSSLVLSSADASFAEVPASTLPCPPAEGLAMLQYTSGSTGRAKGVMLSHSNLLANCQNIYDWLGPDPDRRGCVWLPPYHDMGLLGGILQPLFAGYPLVFFSPLHFLQHPLRWLRTISDFRITLSGAPNFAYELCVDSIDDDAVEALDLSCWRQAFCGAEMVHAETLRAFSAHLAPAKFSARSFTPCYGLAEATLLVSGKPAGAFPVTRSLSREALTHGQAIDDEEVGARVLTACGHPRPGVEVCIVDPETGRRCAEQTVGEIWVSGAAVAQGYWGRPAETSQVFGGRLVGSSSTFLRTGDLGFVSQGELFVTGRLKDLIIIAGKNHHPEDLEATVATAHDLLGLGCAAAFSLEHECSERLVLVVEVRLKRATPQTELALVDRAIRTAVTDIHGVAPWKTLLCRRGVIPRTTSGKVKRSETRSWFVEGRLSALIGDAP